MREQIRMELRREWYNNREIMFGYTMKRRWTSGWNETIIDSSTISRDAIDSMQLRKFCNKPTTLYWAHSAQMKDICPRLIFGCIHKEWFRCYDNHPRMDFEHFFANPVRITSTGPTTISDILEAHKPSVGSSLQRSVVLLPWGIAASTRARWYSGSDRDCGQMSCQISDGKAMSPSFTLDDAFCEKRADVATVECCRVEKEEWFVAGNSCSDGAWC